LDSYQDNYIPSGDTRTHARMYIEQRHWRVVPIPRGQKGPTRRSWQDLKIKAEEVDQYFSPSNNIGVMLDSMADVDLDCPKPECTTVTCGHKC
jgi:hypothetical protein